MISQIYEIFETFDIDTSNIEDILDKIQFLKFEKYKNGLIKGFIYDNQLNDIKIEYVESIISSSKITTKVFNKIYDEVLIKNLKDGRNNISNAELHSAISNVKTDSNINNYYGIINREITSTRLAYFKDFTILCSEMEDILKSIPNSNINITISVPNRVIRNIQLNPNIIFTEAIKSFSSIFDDKIFANLKPKFIYLDEDMELKRKVDKNNSWSATLGNDNSTHPINSRLFMMLDTDLKKLDSEPIDRQEPLLEGIADEFTDMLSNFWNMNLGIKITPLTDSILFKIEEYDEKYKKFRAKSTCPEERSKGFKWYLAYFITLEYMKVLRKKENKDIILLLDDPAVYLHPEAQKLFISKIEELSKEYQIMYNTHLMSLFNENELDRVFLVKHDEKNRTKVNKPWSNNQNDVIQPIRQALGFDKILFEESLKKVLFVEGITDKFVLDGLKKAGKLPKKFKDWHIHPINGGNKDIENNESKKIVKKIKLYGCLSNNEDIKYYFLLDGDMRKNFKSEESEDKIPEKTLFIGDKNQELEDLINREFYLNCVLETYKIIFIVQPEEFKKVAGIVKNLMSYRGSLISKKISENFKQEGVGDFSKSDVARTIKRKLYEDSSNSEHFKKVIEEINKAKL